MSQPVTIRFSLRSVTAVVALLSAYALLLRIPGLLTEVFLALVLASAMLPGVRWLQERRGVPRGLAAMLVFAGVLAVVGLVGALLVPPFIDQASGLAGTMPHLAQNWTKGYDWLRGHGGVWHVLPASSSLPSRVAEAASHVLGQGLDLVQRTMAAVLAIAVVLVLAFFVLVDGPRLHDGLMALIPAPYRALAAAQVEPLALKLGRYVQGTMLGIVWFIGFMAVGLSIVGLPLALGVAVVSGLLEIIPVVGSATAVVLSVSLAATVSGKMVAIVLGLYLAGRLIQDNVVSPFLFAHSLELPPSMVLISMLAGLELMGIPGVLIALPLAATIQVLVQNLYLDRGTTTAEPVEPPADGEAPHLRVSFLPEEEEAASPPPRPPRSR